MESTDTQPIAILGAGSWGTALGLYLARLGQTVRLWTSARHDIERMQAERMNQQYMPGYPFPSSLHPMLELTDVLRDCHDILIAVPSAGFRETLIRLKPLLSPTARILWATKGLDNQSGQLLHEVAVNILGTDYPYAILSGPSFAREVAAGLPTAVVAASQHLDFTQDILRRFNSNLFRVYSSTDMIGVEIGGIVKNVLAIATGIADGMGFGANARSALITRGLAEMIRLGTQVGGQQETFIGLAGLGDLILTCTDDQSRNRRFGLALGKGKESTAALAEIGQVVEGKRNAELLFQLAAKHQIETPIINMVWEILQGKLTPPAAMQLLLSREPKAES